MWERRSSPSGDRLERESRELVMAPETLVNMNDAEPMARTLRRPLRRGDLTVHELDGEGLIFDAASGDTHRLNDTAFFIWSECDGGHDLRRIAEQLAEVYEVSLDEAVGHVKRMLNEFEQKRLLMDTVTDTQEGTVEA